MKKYIVHKAALVDVPPIRNATSWTVFRRCTVGFLNALELRRVADSLHKAYLPFIYWTAHAFFTRFPICPCLTTREKCGSDLTKKQKIHFTLFVAVDLIRKRGVYSRTMIRFDSPRVVFHIRVAALLSTTGIFLLWWSDYCVPESFPFPTSLIVCEWN